MNNKEVIVRAIPFALMVLLVAIILIAQAKGSAVGGSNEALIEEDVEILGDEERGIVCYVYVERSISCLYDPKVILQQKE